jgi:hypothetical protein
MSEENIKSHWYELYGKVSCLFVFWYFCFSINNSWTVLNVKNLPWLNNWECENLVIDQLEQERILFCWLSEWSIIEAKKNLV